MSGDRDPKLFLSTFSITQNDLSSSGSVTFCSNGTDMLNSVPAKVCYDVQATNCTDHIDSHDQGHNVLVTGLEVSGVLKRCESDMSVDSGASLDDSSISSLRVDSMCPCGQTDLTHVINPSPICLANRHSNPQMFPELDLLSGKDTKRAQIELTHKLKQQTRKIKDEFMTFGVAVRKLAKSIRGVESIMQDALSNIGEVVETSDFDSLYRKFKEGADFINYDVLLHRLEILMNSSDLTEENELRHSAEAAAKRYEACFKEYAQQRVVLAPIILQETHGRTLSEHKELKIKIETDFRSFAFHHLFHYKEAVKAILKLPQHVNLRVTDVREGCVEICFETIGSLADEAFRLNLDQKQELLDNNVTLLKYDGKIAYCCCELLSDESSRDTIKKLYDSVVCQADYQRDLLEDVSQEHTSDCPFVSQEITENVCHIETCPSCRVRLPRCSMEYHSLQCERSNSSSSDDSDIEECSFSKQNSNGTPIYTCGADLKAPLHTHGYGKGLEQYIMPNLNCTPKNFTEKTAKKTSKHDEIGPSERRVTKEPLHISGYIEGQLNSQSLHQKCLKTKSKSRPLDEMLHTSAYVKLQLAKSPDDQIQSEPSLKNTEVESERTNQSIMQIGIDKNWVNPSNLHHERNPTVNPDTLLEGQIQYPPSETVPPEEPEPLLCSGFSEEHLENSPGPFVLDAQIQKEPSNEKTGIQSEETFVSVMNCLSCMRALNVKHKRRWQKKRRRVFHGRDLHTPLRDEQLAKRPTAPQTATAAQRRKKRRRALFGQDIHTPLRDEQLAKRPTAPQTATAAQRRKKRWRALFGQDIHTPLRDEQLAKRPTAPQRDQLTKRLTYPQIGSYQSYHFQPPTPSKRNANTLPNLRPSSGMPHPSNYGLENNPCNQGQPEATLPITSLPQGDSKNSEIPPVGLYYHPIQRQHTQTDLKKAVFPGPNGRQSISFTVDRSPDTIPESHDNHVTEQLLPQPCLFSAKRKRELPISGSPEIDQEFTVFEKKENKARCHPGKQSQASSNREVWSPSSDSSPSSLEETPQKGRRSRVVQRMNTDPGDEHTKILTGSGSITAAHAKLIQEFNTGRDMVKLRTKKLSDSESGDRTSGVFSASVSKTRTCIASAQSSGTGIFSELDEHLSSLEGPVHHDILEGPLSSNYNHENDHSASTVVDDQSLSSGTTHPMDSYQRQLSNNSSASYNYHSNSGPQSLAVLGYDHQPRYVSPGYSHEAAHSHPPHPPHPPQGSHSSYNSHPSYSPQGSHSSYNLHSSHYSHPPQGSPATYKAWNCQAATAYSPDAYQRTSHQNSLYETAIHSSRSNVVSSAYPHTIPYHEDSTVEDVPEVNPYAIAAQCVPEVCPYAIAPYSSSEENDSDSESGTKSLPLPPSFHLSLLIEESVRGVDEALAKYDRDIHIMNHRPQRGGKVPTHKQAGMSEEEKYQMQPVTHPVDKDSDYFPIPSNFPRPDPEMVAKQHEMYQDMLSQRFPNTPREDEIIQQSIMARRDQLKQYLLGQFYSDEVYMEHTDWERKTKLGHGAQASCFSVCDNKTQCILVLKEIAENKKALEEAYIALRFASQSNPSPYIVEFYTAALLPGDLVFPKRASPFVQIFMEQMPACLQKLLLKTGPIPLINIHHYACQLFHALDFLHNKQGIIHCDIKPANILVDETAQRIKLTDFGSAEIIGEKRINYSKTFSADPNAGTLSYNPPEFYREQQCSFAFDVWQAGCCVLAMCTGRRPWRHLFMDVYPGKQSDQLTIAIKRNHKLMIQQQRGGHLHPVFLDPTLKRLLHGCLHDNPSSRLTAKECSYLLNTETASTEEDRRKILEAIGYTPNTPEVLQSFSPDQYRVDVYLGSDKLTSISLGHTQKGGPVHLALYGGWLGSLAVPQGMTYREAEEEIHRRFPVARQLGPFILASYDNAPHMIWSACSGGDQVPPYRHTRPDSLVDLNTAIVLSPSTMV